MHGAGARAGQLDVVHMGLITDHQLQGGVDLIGAIRRAFVALHHHGAGTRLDHDQGARENRSRARARIGELPDGSDAPRSHPRRPG